MCKHLIEELRGMGKHGSLPLQGEVHVRSRSLPNKLINYIYISQQISKLFMGSSRWVEIQR